MMVLVIGFYGQKTPPDCGYPQVVTSTLLAVCIRQRPMFRQILFLVPDVLCGPFCNSIHKTQLGRNVKCVNLCNSSCQQMKRVSERGCKAGTFRYNLNTVIQYWLFYAIGTNACVMALPLRRVDVLLMMKEGWRTKVEVVFDGDVNEKDDFETSLKTLQ